MLVQCNLISASTYSSEIFFNCLITLEIFSSPSSWRSFSTLSPSPIVYSWKYSYLTPWHPPSRAPCGLSVSSRAFSSSPSSLAAQEPCLRNSSIGAPSLPLSDFICPHGSTYPKLYCQVPDLYIQLFTVPVYVYGCLSVSPNQHIQSGTHYPLPPLFQSSLPLVFPSLFNKPPKLEMGVSLMTTLPIFL